VLAAPFAHGHSVAAAEETLGVGELGEPADLHQFANRRLRPEKPALEFCVPNPQNRLMHRIAVQLAEAHVEKTTRTATDRSNNVVRTDPRLEVLPYERHRLLGEFRGRSRGTCRVALNNVELGALSRDRAFRHSTAFPYLKGLIILITSCKRGYYTLFPKFLLA